MARKTKYTPEVVEKICEAIARSGSDKAGYEAGGIAQDTFYDWLKKFPEFSESIIAARAEYRQTCPEALIRQAKKAFADYLYGRMEKVVTITERGTNSFGDYEKETIKRLPVGVPRWAIERVLGEKVDELEAVRILVRAGWLPESILEVSSGQYSELRSRIKGIFQGVLPEPELKSKAGISDETADAIRRDILGTESQDSASIPTEVDSGQEPNQGLRKVAAHRN